MSLPEIEQLLARSIGLDSASIGRPAVERAIRERMRVSQAPSVESYWSYLRDSASEIQQLIETVVVHETWFFRDDEAFASLIRTVTNRQESTVASLRMLSVPCSTGEEPYSIAMALLDAGIPQHRFHVDAIDISDRVLAHARRGIYGQNSFRSKNLTFRDRYFRPASQGYALNASLGSAVSFHRGNVVTGQMPVLAGPYDAIYCRNLLIYLDGEAQARVLQTLGSLLTPEGVLFVGPAEAFLASANGFVAVDGPASFGFKRCERARQQPPVMKPRPKVKEVRVERPLVQSPAAGPARRAEQSTAPRLADFAAVERLANEGAIAEAVSSCEKYISSVGPSARAYYLLGVLRDASGRADDAAECYRRAIYLDPNHAEALTHFALHSERRGRTVEAERLRRRASLVSGKTDDHRVTP